MSAPAATRAPAAADRGGAAARATPRRAARLSVRIIGELPAAGRAWRELESRIGAVHVMRSWAWTRAWIRHYGDALRCEFALVTDAGGELAGIALICAHTRRYGPVALRDIWIGTANAPRGEEACPEFNGLLALPGREQAVAAALLAALSERAGWDCLRVHGIAPADARLLTERWPAEQVHISRHPSPCFDLRRPAAGEDIASALRGGARRRARASLRAMSARGALSGEWARGPDQATELLEQLIALHQVRWMRAGEAGVFAGGRFAGLHRELAPALVAEGRAALFRARCDGETIGCLYHLLDGDRVLFYQSGFERFSDNKLRPGLVTHLLCMEQCRQRGLAVYDFLSGGQRYKRELATGEGEMLRVELRRPRARLWLYDRVRELRDRARSDGAPATR